jgi:CBS domain containing-hemolysin-like protein
MDLTTAIAITLIAIFFSAFFSGAEIAFVQSNKVRIEIDATKKGAINHVIHRFSRNADMFISTLLVGNNIALVIYGIGVSILINPLLNTLFDGNQVLVLITNTIASTAVILITGEFLPKTVFRINPNFTMRIIALPLYLIYMLLYPLSLFTAWLSRGIMRLFGIKNTDTAGNLLTMEQLDDYIQQSIDEAPENNEVENEVKIFRNAIDFKDTQVGECMRPRNEIIAVNIDNTDRQQLINTFMQTGLSKIVVYREDIDNVLGYIHVSELFTKDIDWKNCLKPVIFTPESMLANTLMRRLLAEKRSMAIIIDEFGGTAGLVTLEDLVEEIFGEIEDEHDRQRLTVRQHANGDLEISGRAEIEHLNEQYKLDLKESDTYHTLAGYILDNLEALPAKGDTFTIEGYTFTILTMTDTRIEWVLMHPIDK